MNIKKCPSHIFRWLSSAATFPNIWLCLPLFEKEEDVLYKKRQAPHFFSDTVHATLKVPLRFYLLARAPEQWYTFWISLNSPAELSCPPSPQVSHKHSVAPRCILKCAPVKYISSVCRKEGPMSSSSLPAVVGMALILQ